MMSIIMNVPKLRFSEFSGEWEEKKLIEISTWQSGGTPSKDNSEFWGGNIPWISASSMRGNYYSSSKLMITKKAINNGTRLVPKDTLLLLVRGSMLFNLIPVGLTTESVAFNQDVKAIDFNDEISKAFILQWFLHSENRLLNMVVGTGIGAGKLDTNDLYAMKIFLSTKQEQEKMASFLSLVDTKIEQLTSKVKLLQAYKKGVMQKIFSQVIKFEDDDGSEFPEWEEKKLGDVATFSKGKGISKSDIAENGSFDCIRYGELYTTYSEIIQDIKSKTNLKREALVFSVSNDVIIPSSGETSLDIATASCIMKEGVALGGDLNIIKSEENGIFLSYYMNNHLKTKIARLSQGSSVIHLYEKHLRVLKLSLPSKPEQTKIATFLTSIDTKIDQNNKQLEQAKLFKKALLQQMFV